MRGTIAITFDDGNKTDLTVGAQVQIDKGLSPKGTSYVIGSSIGNAGHTMTVNDLHTLVAMGWDVQSHSYSHFNFDIKTTREIYDDIVAQENFFRTNQLAPPRHLAFPQGQRDLEALSVVKRTMLTSRVTEHALFDRSVDIYNLPTIAFNGNSGDTAIISPKLEAISKYGYMATIMIHQLETEGKVTEYGLFIDAIIGLDIRLVTISEMYDLIMRG